MYKFLLFLLLLFCLSGFSQNKQPKYRKFTLPENITQKDYIPNLILVKIRNREETVYSTKSKPKTESEPAARIRLFVKSVKLKTVKQKFPQKPFNEKYPSVSREKTNTIGLDRIYEVRYEGNGKIEDVINDLLKDEAVEYAEPSYLYHQFYQPNDPDFQNIQSYLMQVRAIQAWDLIKSAPNVVIGIVDSGSDLDHPDLAPNIYVNTKDPVNGIDDDNNGYVDDYRGIDLVGTSGNNIMVDNDPNVKNDTTDHGVHVSGLASAVSDNGVGVASIAGKAKLLIVKVAADDDGSTIYQGYDGIKYAADNGAQIINCSWGGESGGNYGKDIINYVTRVKDCLVVAAAGNSDFAGSTSTPKPDFPAAYPGVICVANVDATDAKSRSSNFGSYVSIAAPGVNIFSTGYNGYKFLSGTSMSTPIVSSAAALLKAYFPQLSMKEIGERLIATSDDIDAKNPLYAGLLGKGRLNVYRALTELPVSVRSEKITINDKGGGSIPSGDTVDVYFDLRNTLAPAQNVEVSLSTSSPNVAVLTTSKKAGNFNTGEIKTQFGPFKVYVKPLTPDNTDILFRLNFKGDNYSDYQAITITVALDYLNHRVNHIATTMTSNGRVGYSSPSETNGVGFNYKSKQLLYEGSLMIGNSSTRVSSNTRSDDSGPDDHFKKQERASQKINTIGDFDGRSAFDDSGNPNPLNVFVKYRQLAFVRNIRSSDTAKYIIAEYKVLNRSNAVLNNIYVGLFTDWDIDAASNNVTDFDPITKTAYAYSKNPKAPYAGVKLLTEGSPLYFPISSGVANNPYSDEKLTVQEKFQMLSGGVMGGLGVNSKTGLDIMYVTGAGPFNIAPDDSIRVSFALIGGDNLPDLQASAQNAQERYDIILAAEPVVIVADSVQLWSYQEQNSGAAKLRFSIPERDEVSITLYSLSGQRVKTITKGRNYSKGLHELDLNLDDTVPGIYLCRLRYKGVVKAIKIGSFR